MSYAVHDRQPSQTWNGGMYTPKKRKHTVISRRENTETHDLRSTNIDQTRKEPTRLSSKRNTNSRAGSPEGQFLIDGTVPSQPRPQLAAKRTEARHGPGRHRSVDLKGLIMELIDETYPPLVCPTCLHTASGRSEADLHFKTEHHGTKVFECVHTKCDQAYSSKPGLRYHLEHAHHVTFVTEAAASESRTQRRTDRYNTKSNTTSTSSSTSSSTVINYNNNKHNNDSSNNNGSNNSSKKLKKQELSAHLQKRLDETYDITVCPACKEQFKRKTHVIRHLVEMHHGEEPYKCVVAGCKRTKTYATREGLMYHLVSYHDEMQQ